MQNQEMKKDAGKEPWDLAPWESFTEIVRVLAFGASKYQKHGWRTGMAWSRLLAASIRHIVAWAEGEDTDPESGLSHLAHAATNLCFLIAYAKRGAGSDDRREP